MYNGKQKLYASLLVKNLKGPTDHLRSMFIKGRIILKLILQKYILRARSRFEALGIQLNAGILLIIIHIYTELDFNA
jgi:hypothetical protein